MWKGLYSFFAKIGIECLAIINGLHFMGKLSHNSVWSAIDQLAARYDLSASGLARKAGLDPTIFNKSKRMASNGRERWPSTESLAKIIEATGSSVDEFMDMIQDKLDDIGPASGGLDLSAALPVAQSVPLIGLAEAGTGGYFTHSGFPSGHGWDEVSFPGAEHEGVYALEVSGNSMLPLYREGDVLVVSATAQVHRGDRVVVKTLDGEVMAKVLSKRTEKSVELESINPDFPNRQLKPHEIDWIHRILWARQ
jgi:phage repressor protein C with HTH and peptisase S24 domain